MSNILLLNNNIFFKPLNITALLSYIIVLSFSFYYTYYSL